MKHLFFSIFLMLLSTLSFSQKKNSFDEFLSIFTNATLPYCVDFKDANISYATENFYQNDSIRCTYEYVLGITNNDYDTIIPEIWIKKYLLKDGESVYNPDMYSSGYDTTSKSVFVPIHLFKLNKSYYGLTFTKYCSVGWPPYAEKYCCTLNKKGDIISKVVIATFIYAETFTHDNCDDDPETNMRIPYHYETNACIDSYGVITIKETARALVNQYRISKDGRITEIQ